MRMKKLTALLLACVLLAGLFTGCKDSGAEDVALLTGMSVEQVQETYKKAKAYYNTGDYLAAAGMYDKVSGYKDASERAGEAVETYQKEVAEKAAALCEKGSYEDAAALLDRGVEKSGQGQALQEARDTVEAALTDAYLEKAQSALAEKNYDGARSWLKNIRQTCRQEDSRVTAMETEIFAAQRDDYLEKARAALAGKDFSGAQVWLDSISQNGPADARVTEMQNDIWNSLTEDYLQKSEAALTKKDYAGAAAWLDSIRQACGTVDPKVETQAKRIQKTEILDRAAQFDAEEDMAGKLGYLRSVLNEGCSDTDIVSLYNSDYAAYKTRLLADAQTAFEEQGYEAAVRVLKEHFTVTASDVEVQGKIKEYESYAPVWLADLKPFVVGKDHFKQCKDNVTDNLGNTYSRVLGVGDSVGYNGPTNAWETYKLKGSYSSMTGWYYIREVSKSETETCTLTITGNGKVLYEYKGMTGGVEPVYFEIDVTGVDELTVDLSSKTWSTGYFQIGDAQLWK